MSAPKPTDRELQQASALIDEWYSGPVLSKARGLINQDRVHQDPEATDVFSVRGSTRYRVQVIEEFDEDAVVKKTPEQIAQAIPFVSCSCPNGNAKGGRPTCYHSAAVILTLMLQQPEQEPEQSFVQGGDPHHAEPAGTGEGLSDEEVAWLNESD